MAFQQILLILVMLQVHWQMVQSVPANTSTTPEPQTSSSTTTSSPVGEIATNFTTTTTNSPGESKGQKQGAKKRHHAHRVRDGQKQSSVPSYISTIWSPHKPRESNDGKLVGIGIKVGEQHTLVHADSWAQVKPGPDMGARNRPTNVHKLNQADHQINTVQRGTHPTQLNVNTGWNGIHTNANNDIGMHTFTLPDNRERQGPFSLLNHDTPKFNNKEHLAPLERNKNNFGKDCHLHGYSVLTPKSRKTDIVADEPDRHFVKFPVMPNQKKCNNGFCTLTTGESTTQVCQHADRGAPVTCDGKVTYLAMPQVNDAGCATSFDAYHVPHLASRFKI